MGPAIALAAALAASLPLAAAQESSLGGYLVLEVGPRSVPCDEDAPRRCFEAREAGESVWQVFHGVVDGFGHREGHASVLLVRSAPEPVPSDAPGPHYTLVHTLADMPLAGASWRLERYGELGELRDPLVGTEVHFEVASGGTLIQGFAGCNAFSGPIAVDGDGVRVGPLVSTLRACAPEVMEQERAVLTALGEASRVTFYGEGVAFAGETVRARFTAVLSDRPLTWTQGPSDPEVLRFARHLTEAAAVGASWTRDPVRVALNFIDSRGAPRVDVTRRDDQAEAPTHTVVVVDEDGFLDDSVRGVRSEVVLAPDAAGAWHLLAVTVATRCWRVEQLMVSPGEFCP
jgi:heat shock protein HslJ